MIHEFLKDFEGSCEKVAILLLRSSSLASSKKLHKKAFLISVQDVRDPGGNCLSQYEASPASEYLKSLKKDNPHGLHWL